MRVRKLIPSIFLDEHVVVCENPTFHHWTPILCVSNAVDPTVNKASRDTTTNGWYEPSPHCRLIIGVNTLLTNQARPWKKPDDFFYCNKSMAAVQNLMFKLRGFALTSKGLSSCSTCKWQFWGQFHFLGKPMSIIVWLHSYFLRVKCEVCLLQPFCRCFSRA